MKVKVVPTSNLKTVAGQLTRQAKAYFGAPVGEFYAIGANRLMLYPFMAVVFVLECLVYWAIIQGPAFILQHMAFSTVYSLHKAALFTLCLFAADLLASRLLPAWGAYKERTVGRQWIIWAVGLVAGLLLLRPLVSNLVVYYAPKVVDYYALNPQARPTLAKILMILLPYWGMAVLLAMQVAKSKAQIKRLADQMVIMPEAAGAQGFAPLDGSQKYPKGILKLGKENGNGAINLADITHITVEDHYCRINYSTRNGLKNIFIRLPLKEMMLKLPQGHFLQTHRSHVVNLGHVSRLAKDGREYKVVLHRFDLELPVSRHRFKQLEPMVRTALEANTSAS